MSLAASHPPGRADGEEPAQLRHERDTLGLVPLYVAGGTGNAHAVFAIHEDSAQAVWKHTYADYHTVTFHVAGAPLYRRRKRRGAADVAVAGSVSLQSSDEESLWDSDARLRWVQFYLPVSFVMDLATQAIDIDGGRVTLDRATGIADPRLLRIAYAALLACRQATSPAPEEINAWSYAIAGWLLGAHSNVKQRFAGLRKERLTAVKLRAVTEFIEAHLTEPIAIADLARELAMSEFHFIRAFTTVAGSSPYQYIIGRRVNRACRLLQSTDESIAGIAYEAGFSSQAHLTSTFARIIGLTPALYRSAIADL